MENLSCIVEQHLINKENNLAQDYPLTLNFGIVGNKLLNIKSLNSFSKAY